MTENCINPVVLLKVFLYNRCIPTVLEHIDFIQFENFLYNLNQLRQECGKVFFPFGKGFC